MSYFKRKEETKGHNRTGVRWQQLSPDLDDGEREKWIELGHIWEVNLLMNWIQTLGENNQGSTLSL